MKYRQLSLTYFEENSTNWNFNEEENSDCFCLTQFNVQAQYNRRPCLVLIKNR